MDSYHKIKNYLLLKQKEVTSKLKSLDKDDSLDEVAPESLELGTSSWQADMDATRAAIKQQLSNFSKNLQLTLTKLQQGTYGLCDKCKRQIEKERLEIMPTASHCIACVN